MDNLPKNYAGLTMADWLSFRRVLEEAPVAGQEKHEQLFSHLCDLVNKSLKSTRFVSTHDDVYDAFMRGRNWVSAREPGYVAEPLIEKPAMLLADRVLVAIATGLNKKAGTLFKEAAALHEMVGKDAANDAPVTVAGLLAKAKSTCELSLRCLSPLYTAYSPEGICRVDWPHSGETRNFDFNEIGTKIDDALAGKFPKPPRKAFSVKAAIKQKLARIGLCKPPRPQKTPAQMAKAEPVQPPAND